MIRLLALFLTLSAAPPAAFGGDVEISDARRDDDGFLVHTVESPYQAGKTDVRVLLPDDLKDGVRLPVAYVLPVEAGRENRYGDGLLEVQKHDLHNSRNLIFVAPSFSHLPWYADHATKPEIRQETYILKVIVPFIEKTYPSSKKSKDRLLLGFSKSGWGAWSLLLRHPDRFGRAAAWDAPLLMTTHQKYGAGEVFGTPKNFERYRVEKLLKTKANKLRGETRLILTGYGNFRPHHEQAHTLLDELKIPHEYRDGPKRKHDWHSGWVPEAVESLSGSISGSPVRSSRRPD